MLLRIKNYLGVLPALLITYFLFWRGIFKSIILGSSELGKVLFGTIKHSYRMDASVPNDCHDLVNSFWYTVRVSGFSILGVAIFSLIVIFIIFLLSSVTNLKKKKWIKTLIALPMYIPYLLSGYIIVIILSQGGILSTIFYKLGFIKEMSQFPILVNESFGFSIIFSYIWKASPFIFLMVYPLILKINSTWLEPAKVYGINRWYFFIKVVLPLIMPTYLSALFVVGAYIFSAFEIPFLLGVTYPRTLSVMAYEKYARDSILYRDEVLGINLVILLVILIAGIILLVLNKKFHERVDFQLEK